MLACRAFLFLTGCIVYDCVHLVKLEEAELP